MKIILAHNRYQFAGGEDVVVQAEKALLESYDHEVLVLEVDNNNIVGAWSKAKAATGAIYSSTSRDLLHTEITQFQPNVVHIHNFFPILSPSVYDSCWNSNVPVVQTLHNYRLGCPNALLFRDGKVCEDCLDKPVPWPGVMHGCYRGSITQSAVVATMLAVHRLRGTWQKRVNAYITLTNFQKGKMIQAGLPEEKIHVKPNFAFDPGSPVDTDVVGSYALYAGRLSVEKGVATLIDAYMQNDSLMPLQIVGDGPLRNTLQERVQALGLENKIKFLGQQEKTSVLTLMRSAQVLIFPSIWYETFGLTIIEAFACGLPVIASRIGCMMELVEDSVTGLHFETGNSLDLAEKMSWAITHKHEIAQMKKNARQVYETRYIPKYNYQQLMNIYHQVVIQDIHSQVTAKSRLNHTVT